MTDLEQRVRDELAAMAGELAPSDGGWAEQLRRQGRSQGLRFLGRRLRGRRRGGPDGGQRGGRPGGRPGGLRPARWRAPALVAAAAVTLLAGIAIPIVLTGSDPSPAGLGPDSGPSTDSGPTPGTLPSTAPAAPDRPVSSSAPAGPDRPVVAEFTEGGSRWQVFAYTRRHQPDDEATDQVCVVGVPAGQAADGPVRYPGSECRSPFDWPAGQPNPLVHSRSVLGGATLDSGPLPGMLVFVARPVVATLEVRDGPGAPAPVREVDRADGVALFVADLGVSTQGFGYTARDASGAVIESAIT